MAQSVGIVYVNGKPAGFAYDMEAGWPIVVGGQVNGETTGTLNGIYPSLIQRTHGKVKGKPIHYAYFWWHKGPRQYWFCCGKDPLPDNPVIIFKEQ
jgi:hypothetical protein